jgi:hypothetical protein
LTCAILPYVDPDAGFLVKTHTELRARCDYILLARKPIFGVQVCSIEITCIDVLLRRLTGNWICHIGAKKWVLYLSWGCAKVTAMEYPLLVCTGSRPYSLLKKKKRAAWAVICVKHGDLYTPCPWHLKGGFKFEIDNPFGINSELLAD